MQCHTDVQGTPAFDIKARSQCLGRCPEWSAHYFTSLKVQNDTYIERKKGRQGQSIFFNWRGCDRDAGHSGRQPTMSKTWVYWSTNQARDLVRKVLQSHSDAGLHRREIYERIHELYPDQKHDLVPHQHHGKNPPPRPMHPIRSQRRVKATFTYSARLILPRYLKAVVLPEMEAAGELQRVLIRVGKGQDDGPRVDSVRYKQRLDHRGTHIVGFRQVPTDAVKKLEYRWRLTPGFVPPPKVDPEPEFKFLQRAQKAKVKWQQYIGRKRR